MQDLEAAAEAALQNSYSPYSGWRVGAAVRTRSGAIYQGVNVECASYPLTSCAERSAIAAAVLVEGATVELLEVAVAARDDTGESRSAPPCGACRQLIWELGADARVSFVGADGKRRQLAISALLPEAFRLADR